MSSTTLDFSTIEPVYSRDLLNLEFDYHEDRHVKTYLQKQYVQQKRISDKQFSMLLDKANSSLLQEIEDFIDETQEAGEQLFPGTSSNLVHAATVILGMQTSDHLPTIDMIENHISESEPKIQILRITPDLSKKTELHANLSQVKKSKKLLVLIEQTEEVETVILESLINTLYSWLQLGQAKWVMALFCMSGNSTSVSQLVPLVMNRIETMKTIVKDYKYVGENLQMRLINSKNMLFKLGPNLIEFIHENITCVDASITNLKFLFQFAMFEYHAKYNSLLTLPLRDLTKILDSDTKSIARIRNMKSLQNDEDDSSKEVDWNDSSSVAKFCVRNIKCLQNYHDFILNQMNCYLNLIVDETNQNFPSDLNDIYSKLLNHEDLGQSVDFVDAIGKLRNYPVDRILKRIRSCIEQNVSESTNIDKNRDVHTILISLKEKLENNEGCEEVVRLLINKLLKHAQLLKNPLKLPLHEAFYHDDQDFVRLRTSPSTRFDARTDCISTDNYFSILYKLIHESAEDISATDLFNDFKQVLKERLVMINSCKTLETPRGGPKLKTTTKRASRQSLKRAVNQRSVTSYDQTEEMDEGLAKAIFVDLIDCMEYQGLIKSDKRKSKKGTVKRCVWL